MDELGMDVSSPTHDDIIDANSRVLVALAEPTLNEMMERRLDEIYDSESESDSDIEQSEAETGNPRPTIEMYREDIEVAVTCLFTILPSVHFYRYSRRLDLAGTFNQACTPTTERHITVQTSPGGEKKELGPPIEKTTEAIFSSEELRTMQSELVEVNIELTKKLLSIIAENLDGETGARTRFSSTLQKEMLLLERYHRMLGLPKSKDVTDDEIQLCMEQNQLGLGMAQHILTTGVKPLRTAKTAVKEKGYHDFSNLQSVDDEMFGMLTKFQHQNAKLVAYRDGAGLVSAAA
jgi:hypothetical protein